jgi:glycerate 2-kinase
VIISQLRQAARQIWEAAFERADPGRCIREALTFRNGELFIKGKAFPLNGRLYVIGAGKASAKMAQATEEILGDAITGGIVVTKYGHGLPVERIKIVEAGHPIPDLAGVRAVARTRDLLSRLNKNDTVLCLISGGGSALWPAPASPVTLDEIQDVTGHLLRAGATIHELNAVRKHLSAIKGGQLVQWASPARVISLIVSDVVGDSLDFIASGPTVPDTTSFPGALNIVQQYDIKVPSGVADRLHRGAAGEVPETPKPGARLFENVDNVSIANNRVLVDAACDQAKQLGFQTLILGTEVEGEAKEIARFYAAIAREIAGAGHPVKPPACVLGAGETTVTVRGHGLGGRNQEMALAWAIAVSARPPSAECCFASIASDGTDGPTSAAGGLVDPFTCSRAVELGMIPSQYLRENDSSNFLKSTGDLIVTGPTQTNLMDLQILLVDERREVGV